MFTGIVEIVGEVRSVEAKPELTRLTIAVGDLAEGVELGDSIAVNGACLTVAQSDGDLLGFDAVRETLERTSLGELAPGCRVNLERAMRADDRLDGHIVQGHVDGKGTVTAMERIGDDVKLFVECGAEFADLLVDKGSVAIDGVSLTVVDPGERDFHVVLIPHTLEITTFGQLGPGQKVNLEADVLGKYVKRYLERTLGQRSH
jgi:riboflavin synthase